MNQLKDNLDKETMEKCERFIKERREIRHLKTFDQQVSKFERLCHKNTGGCINNQHGVRSVRTIHVQDQSKINQTTNNNYTDTLVEEENVERTEQRNINHNIWVKNLCKIPLTEVEERLLAHGPNFAAVPRELLVLGVHYSN